MKRVLVVSYHFPPSDEVGSLRPARFAQFLPDSGWHPHVLTAGIKGSGTGTVQFALEAPIDVSAAPVWPGLRDWMRGVPLIARSKIESEGADSGWAETYETSTARRPLRDLAYSLMWLPDDRHGWIWPAVGRGLQLIRELKPDVLLVTSPPHSAQVAGLLLSRIGDIPLVVDFRDPWVGNPATPEFIRSGPTPRVHEWLEGCVLRRAAAIVTATRDHARALEARKPGTHGRVHVIPNGFDVTGFDGVETKGADTFTITYAGSFYHTRTPQPLFEAIRILREDHGIDSSRIIVKLIGNCDTAGGRSVVGMARDAGCESSLVLPGRLPHREVLGELATADMLLLLASEQPEQIPAKAYEYLAAGPPILALVEPGATADLLEGVGGADVLMDADPAAIADVLAEALEAWAPRLSGSWTCPPAAAAYDRKAIAGALSRVLDAVSRAR